jgi:hypothetical protein
LKNIPNWIVGLTELHQKFISIQSDEGVNHTAIEFISLHFMLVVEVIEMNRILDL